MESKKNMLLTNILSDKGFYTKQINKVIERKNLYKDSFNQLA